MKTSEYKFELPKSLIADYPLKKRTDSKLLCLNNNLINHKNFIDIIGELNSGDLLVLNNSKVMPARLFGKKETGGKVELLIERILDKNLALSHIKSSKSLKENQKIYITEYINITVKEKKDNLYLIELENILSVLENHGQMPLPPYMQRQGGEFDKQRYQTVYADDKKLGSVAAPTAGLHFDNEILEKIKNKGVNIEYITLNVGAGTFQPIRVENINDHKMHSETIEVTSRVCEKIIQTKQNNKKVIAVGTTAVRSLETAALSGKIQPFCGETDIFIKPGFKFNVVDSMITNFHLPESSLIILVSAFAGYNNIMSAYKEAIDKKYRFYSYGDAMFLNKN